MELLSVSFVVSGIALLSACLASYLLMTAPGMEQALTRLAS
jgi:hypothetical protein